MFLLKVKKKDLEKEIAKLEAKLEKVNAKIARKEAKKLERAGKKQLDVVAEVVTEPEFPEIPKAREEVTELQVAPKAAETKSVEAETTKRKPGRPKKVVSEPVSKKEEPREVVKRKPGRPKKDQSVASTKEVASEPQTKIEEVVAEKRGRGRPKKAVSQQVVAQAQQQPKVTKKVSAEEKPARYYLTFDEERNKWVIKKSGAARIIASFASKEEAVKRAKELARNNGAHLSVQRKDGKFSKQ